MPSATLVDAVRPLRVISHESESDRWLMAEGQPDPRLRGVVLDYCEYEEQTTSFRRRRELPSGRVILILNLGPPLTVALPTVAAQATEYARGFFAGLHDSYALTDSGGYQRGVEVAFTPIGAHLILGIPMHETSRCVLEVEHALGAEGVELLERVKGATTREQRFTVVERFLLARLERAAPPDPGVAFAWERLRTSKGAAPIGVLAGELGWSHRRLVARFRSQVGLPPKLIGRILRFEHVMESVAAGPEVGWAEIAQQCGYFDQAHLIRDVHQFAGATPGELSRRLLPDGGGVVGD